MKRCRSISVAALMGISALSITACEEAKVDATVFSNLQQCLDDGGLPQEQCEAGLREARSQHAEVSPKYSSKEDCEGDFGAGKCETAPYRTASGGSVFMPLMMGYMMGSMLGGRRGSVFTQPLYRSADDPKSYRTADNRKVAAKSGRTQVASSAGRRPSMKTSTLSRGGFGSSGRRLGSAAT